MSKKDYHNPIREIGDEFKEYIVWTFWRFTLIKKEYRIGSPHDWDSYRIVFKDYRKFKK